MQKSNLFVAGLIFLALVLTSCSQAISPATTTKQPTATTAIATTEEVTTKGTMSSEVSYANGKASLSVTDSSGGTYKFTQADSQSAARSVSTSTGGTWDYTNAFDVKQFSGNYTGNITAETGIGSLNLEVTQAADSGDTMRPVTEATSFEFTVKGNQFEATIPAVEIVVQQSAVKEKIKTVTCTLPTDNGTCYSNDVTHTIDFYSDKTFRMYSKFQCTVKEDGFSFIQNGLGYIGTYEGDPKKDGEVILNVKKYNEPLIDRFSEDIFNSYKRGASSKTAKVKEEDLISFNTTQTIVITGDRFTFPSNSLYADYTENQDRKTSFQVNITGDDVEKFKVAYQVFGEQDNIVNPKTIDVSEREEIQNAGVDTRIEVTVFIDKDGNNKMEYEKDVTVLYSSFSMKQGYHGTIKLEIKKASVSFNIIGDTSQYQNIQVRQGDNDNSVPKQNGKIDVYFVNRNNQGFNPSILLAEEVEQSNISSGYSQRYGISDNMPTISYSDGRVSPSHVTFKIKDKLEDGNKILIVEDSSGTAFRFEKEQPDGITFYIPTGANSDGAFLSKYKRGGNPDDFYHAKEALINLTYVGGIWHVSAMDNFEYQLSGVKENMQDIVEYLEKRKKLTVEGKELLEQIK